MDNIKRKITALNETIDDKDDIITTLSESIKAGEAKKQQAEELNRSLTARLKMVESELDKTEEKLEKAKQELATVLEDQESLEGNLKQLECCEQDHNDKLDLQAEELREARGLAEEADRKYDEISRKLMMMEVEFEKAETRLEAAQAKHDSLVTEGQALSESLKSYEAIEAKLGEREVENDAELYRLKSELRDSEYQREEAQKEVAKLEKTCDDLQYKLEEVNGERERIEQELNKLLNDLEDL